MTQTAPRVLIVDDDPAITSALVRGLRQMGYAPEAAHQTADALERLKQRGFDAAIVDVMIGADSGLELVRAARSAGVTIPVLMLSALSTVEDRAAGLDAGADDYVVKPFSFEELAARLTVQERRAREARASLDTARRMLSRAGRAVTLTQRECALLTTLAQSPGVPLTRGALFDQLWATEGASAENVVDVYVGALRRKLSQAGGFGFELTTLRGRGFQLDGLLPRIE